MLMPRDATVRARGPWTVGTEEAARRGALAQQALEALRGPTGRRARGRCRGPTSCSSGPPGAPRGRRDAGAPGALRVQRSALGATSPAGAPCALRGNTAPWRPEAASPRPAPRPFVLLTPHPNFLKQIRVSPALLLGVNSYKFSEGRVKHLSELKLCIPVMEQLHIQQPIHDIGFFKNNSISGPNSLPEPCHSVSHEVDSTSHPLTLGGIRGLLHLMPASRWLVKGNEAWLLFEHFWSSATTL